MKNSIHRNEHTFAFPKSKRNRHLKRVFGLFAVIYLSISGAAHFRLSPALTSVVNLAPTLDVKNTLEQTSSNQADTPIQTDEQSAPELSGLTIIEPPYKKKKFYVLHIGPSKTGTS
eukprot:CAMPEP_0194359030 /NCGR_PEP_ID=MMETSP0174-20130528/6285_1 /TAXON_ID=216777 /ORGANISM="Proboscia alata, Strain PI-D3" /LENGTH=115 /DNA_ID=CAMNT_0039129703 /DNA_START=110 /DNA_END=453 /DNA_ORIENTATION=-